MSEIFSEIDEDLRREKLRKLWERYSVFIVAAAILIVAAVGGWRGYMYLEAKKAAEAGSAFEAANTPHSFGFVTADLSFITCTHVLPTMANYLAPGGHLLALIKPQFELQPAQIGKGGLVKDKAHFAEVETRIREACKALGLKVQKYFESPIKGGNGNTEFFVWAQPA